MRHHQADHLKALQLAFIEALGSGGAPYTAQTVEEVERVLDALLEGHRVAASLTPFGRNDGIVIMELNAEQIGDAHIVGYQWWADQKVSPFRVNYHVGASQRMTSYVIAVGDPLQPTSRDELERAWRHGTLFQSTDWRFWFQAGIETGVVAIGERGQSANFCWSSLSATGRTPPNADRVKAFDICGALAVVLADGAGNSRRGSGAADIVVDMALASRHLREGDIDEWVLQELLLEADRAVHLQGGETTAALAVFRGDEILAAAAGDSIVMFDAGEGLVRFPEPRTKYRIGSGEADVRVMRSMTRSTTFLLTDGAAACVTHADVDQGLQAGFDPEELVYRASRLINERMAYVGDDATVLAVGRRR